MNKRLLVMDKADNVGVLLEASKSGDRVMYQNGSIELLEDIEFAHKIALADIPVSQPVVKYGQEIGHAETDIRKGQWVHVHNMGCRRGK